MSRSSIGRYLGRLAYQIAEEYARTRYYNHGAPKTKGEAPQTPFFVQTVNEEWSREEKQHRKEEKDFWRNSLRYTAIAGGAAAIAAGFSIGAFYQARRQAAAAEAQNRPWLRVDKLNSYTFTQRGDGLFFDLGLDVFVKNIGHSPSTRVYAFSTFKMFGTEYDSELAGARKVCERAVRPEQRDWLGAVVFPDEDGYVKSISFRTYAQLAGVFNDREVDTIPKKERMRFDAYLPDAAIEVVGCLLYSDASGREYKTSFDFVANHIDLSLPRKPDKTIEFSPYLFGGSYAE